MIMMLLSNDSFLFLMMLISNHSFLFQFTIHEHISLPGSLIIIFFLELGSNHLLNQSATKTKGLMC